MSKPPLLFLACLGSPAWVSVDGSKHVFLLRRRVHPLPWSSQLQAAHGIHVLRVGATTSGEGHGGLRMREARPETDGELGP